MAAETPPAVVAAACGLALAAVGLSAAAGRGGVTVPGLVIALQAALLLAGVAWIAMRAVSRPAPPAEEVVPLSALGDLVTWHDAQGDVLRASPASLGVIGASPPALLGDGLARRVLVADRPAFLKALSDAANGAGPVTVAIRLHAGGAAEGLPQAVIFAEMRVSRLVPPAAAAAHAPPVAAGACLVSFIRDVSAQHKHAGEIEAARQDAEKANELKGRFLATVSHELRTPLNAIIGFSELLCADHPFLVTEERRKEYAQIIRNSGHHLLGIVNTLLDMSKIETGNFHFDPEPFDFRDLASSVCDLMQLKADEAGVLVERRLETGLQEIVADRRACRQILINLLSNAVKFTPRGGRVTVRLAAAADAIVLTIADTGIGIPEADLPRLGDPFFQSGELHRRNTEGTGLGLSVVRGIVGLHHGQITVESGAGAGTTVSVTLPVRPDLGPARSKPVALQTRARVALRPVERKIA
ncbi:PAS domain-containing sensor histidine kinase [Enterovirga sp.]|uniref:sensor histidine kinase n=1 Tax=Enterovirga sp. TaxID=2026350 RepID=UPI002B598B2B|nr:PAS domain-containing sensor histidine kinase [Enterovirga sp.]HMO29768.1 PAS domain-containing sensor histidine kinase [Enterovirga sp.]